jgi:hypothetical protein
MAIWRGGRGGAPSFEGAPFCFRRGLQMAADLEVYIVVRAGVPVAAVALLGGQEAAFELAAAHGSELHCVPLYAPEAALAASARLLASAIFTHADALDDALDEPLDDALDDAPLDDDSEARDSDASDSGAGDSGAGDSGAGDSDAGDSDASDVAPWPQ